MDDFILSLPTIFDNLKDIEDLKRWSGLPSFEVLHIIKENIQNLSSAQQDLKPFKISIELLILLVLIKIKKNLCFTDMQILFNMNEQKISKYFHNFIPILRSALEPALFWPTK